MRNLPAGKLTISIVTRLGSFSVNGVGEAIRGIGETGFLTAAGAGGGDGGEFHPTGCKAFKT
jgi:hypothetical protein